MKPATSVTAPPPTPMTRSLRVKPCAAKGIPGGNATVADFAPSASGTSIAQRPRHVADNAVSRSIDDLAPPLVDARPQRDARQPAPARATPQVRQHRRRLRTGASPATMRRSVIGSPARSSAVTAVAALPVLTTVDGRDLFVERTPGLHQCVQLCARIAEQQRAIAVEPHPLRGVGEVDVDVNNAVVVQQFASARFKIAPPPTNEHAFVFCATPARPQRFRASGNALRRVRRKMSADASARDLLDIEIGVAKGRTESAREQSANGALACSGRTHEDHERRHQSVHDQGVEVAAHIAAHLIDVSRHRTSRARNRRAPSATIASATTPAAGTAHTSLRWLIAFAASPVATSIVSKARGTVEMGFIAARTRNTSPVDMPPSVPPARLVRRRTPLGTVLDLVVGE